MTRRQGGGDKLFSKKKEELKKLKSKEIRPSIIIACEDQSSAPEYFEQILKELIDKKKITQDSYVFVPHKHTDPKGVLKDLKRFKTLDNGQKYSEFEHKWIVIDRDVEVLGGGHKKENFKEAILGAKSKRQEFNVEVAYSNECFELWYLLHFDNRCTGILRKELLKLVIQRLKKSSPYEFSNLNKDNIKDANYTRRIYKHLKDKQHVALKNAKCLLESYGANHDPESDNPSTTVHLLVNLLNNMGEN